MHHPTHPTLINLRLAALLVLTAGLSSTAHAAAARPFQRAIPQTAVSLKFDFSANGDAKPDWTKVAPTAVYSADTGYGFEPGAQITSADGGNIATSDRAFFFSAKVPEGNYLVTVTFGDSANATVTTLKAESSRLMEENVQVPAGKIETRSFDVNVRTPALGPVPTNAPGGTEVREDQFDASNARDWDDKLTIEVNSTHAALRSIEMTRVNDVPTVFLASDSTVTDHDNGSVVTWGQLLPRFLKPGVAVADEAQSGETLKTFMDALRLEKILSQMKAGDYLFIQFAHNDEKNSWPQSYVEPESTYKAYLKVYIAEVRLLHATPVLVTSMNRVNFNSAGLNTNSHGGYPDAMREVAKEENVALIDLNLMSQTFYNAMGPANAKLISQDGTHPVLYGGYEQTKCIVMGIKQNNLDLAKYIVDDFKDFDPAHPDPVDSISVPPSPSSARAGGRAGAGARGARGTAAGTAPAATTTPATPAATDPGPGPL
jgi:lysophospholipase L1-like esterase